MSADAIVVGSGPNGLAAAIVLARAGRKVLVREAQPTIGGGARTGELTLPGFQHDLCSAIHPLGFASPFLSSLPLAEHGLEWVHPDAPLAHPLDDGTAVMLERSPEATGAGLDPHDRDAWPRLMHPFVTRWDALMDEALGPLHVPSHPFLLAAFGLQVLPSARWASGRFRGERAKALWAGIAAHSIAPLEWTLTSAYALMLGGAGHAVGWPFPRGGSGAITQAMASYLRTLGGEIATNAPVTRLDELDAPIVMLDLTPRQVVKIGGERLSAAYRRSLEAFVYGPGSFKVDWALSEPVPWTAPEARRTACLHLGGTFDEIAASERAPWEGRAPERPYVLVAQPSLFDSTRAPEGKHTLWAYAHVPNGSDVDMLDRIEAQIERYAPGFRDVVLARCVTPPSGLEAKNANLVGGDIGGGANIATQTLLRPVWRWNPYRTPLKGVYLCSSSTPPGGGVHGMCGVHAARSALRDG